jgi:hypothetical protein
MIRCKVKRFWMFFAFGLKLKNQRTEHKSHKKEAIFSSIQK